MPRLRQKEITESSGTQFDLFKTGDDLDTTIPVCQE